MGLLAKDHPISVNVVTLNHVIRLMCALISTPSVPSGSKCTFNVSPSQWTTISGIRDTARPSTSRGCRRTVQKHVENVPNRPTRARMSMMYHVQDGNSRASATLMPSRNCIISTNRTLLCQNQFLMQLIGAILCTGAMQKELQALLNNYIFRLFYTFSKL